VKSNQKPTKDVSVVTIGIDLGTTNSEIAISINGKVEIIKNAQQDEYTPSVFGVDKAGNKVVGRKAYNKLFESSSDDEFVNNKAEVKRLMGTAETIRFERLDASLTPEDISAEILKSLKEDVTRKYPDFSTIAAVITIPAYFSALQAEATKRAGLLAGFRHVVLLQEPIAAAMAYGFDNSENQNLLVYDLGGGTFDVALISSKDGILTVLGQSGDNFLGGKEFDLKIVEEIIQPAILDKFNFKNFNRSNDKYKSVFAKLKAIAEAAKIELSQYDKVTLEVENIGSDDDGKEVYVSFDFTRQQFEDLISPLVTKTVDLIKKTLTESGVKSSAVSKIVLVGGPTQIPYIRESLEKEFDVTIDASIDPLTVVARGACVYGLSQRIPQDLLLETRQTNDEELKLELRYEAMTAEDEQTVTGRINDLKHADEDYFIQIQSEGGFYSSSKIRLKNGKFFDRVVIEKGKTNTYWLYLFNEEGKTVPVFPESFSITHGLTISGTPIPHTIGAVYAQKGISSSFQLKNVCDTYFEKGSILPLEKTKPYKTVKKLLKGQDNKLPIIIYEGEYSNPDNNETITNLYIDGSKLPYDLPESTDVDLTIKVDKSRTVDVVVYIPSLDLTLAARADTYGQTIDSKKLTIELETQKERLKQIEGSISSDDQSKLKNSIDTLETNIKNAENDTDDKGKAARDMKELKSNLDKIERDRTMPQLSSEFHEKIEQLKNSIDSIEDESERGRVADIIKNIEPEGEKAITSNDKDILIRLNEQLRDTYWTIIAKNPAVWIYYLNEIKLRKDESTNPTESEYHISKAEQAAEVGDVGELERHVRSLWKLLPEEVEAEIKDMSGITK